MMMCHLNLHPISVYDFDKAKPRGCHNLWSKKASVMNSLM